MKTIDFGHTVSGAVREKLARGKTPAKFEPRFFEYALVSSVAGMPVLRSVARG